MSSGAEAIKGLDKLAGTRKVKQLVATSPDGNIRLYALCWDGTMWVRAVHKGGSAPYKWERIEDISA